MSKFKKATIERWDSYSSNYSEAGQQRIHSVVRQTLIDNIETRANLYLESIANTNSDADTVTPEDFKAGE